MFERRKAKKAIEEKLNAIQMNLENNYKDLTISSHKEAVALIKKYLDEGILNPGDVTAYQRKLTEYEAKMQHYGHANISSFLKERY